MKFQISDCLLFCTLLSCSLRLAALPSFLFFSIKELICRAEITVNLRSYQNNINAEIATELLSDEGLIIERAKDGVDCVEMLEKAPDDYYDIILMDIQMPIMNGYEAAAKIRRIDDRKKADIPIIALTANAFSEDKDNAIKAGMNDHVPKPIDMNVLLPAMQKLITGK